MQAERYSYSGGRRKMCKSVGLAPSGGCTKALSDAGWKKGSKDEAIDILCEAGALSGADCAFFRAGGETPQEDGGTTNTAIWIAVILLILLIVGAIIYKRVTKK